MKFINYLKKQWALSFMVGLLLSFTSCGSFQYAGTYEDGIYADSEPVVRTNEAADNTSNSSEYYKNYFKEKSLQLEEDNAVFTDVDAYQGDYQEDSTNSTNYAGWGQNNDSDVTINIYDNTPFYGYGWGHPYNNFWGWNNGWSIGWNSWGYSRYNPWCNPFIGFGYNNFGYNNYGYGFGYNNYGYNNYRGRSVAYINGRRTYNGSRNNSLSSRSALSTTARTRSAVRSSRLTKSTTETRTRSAVRSSRPTQSTTSKTRTRTTRPTQSNTTTRSTTTTRQRSTTTSRPRTTTTRSRSSSPTTRRSSAPSRSSSRSSSSRRRN